MARSSEVSCKPRFSGTSSMVRRANRDQLIRADDERRPITEHGIRKDPKKPKLTDVEFYNLIKNATFIHWLAGTTSQPTEWQAEGTPTIAQDTVEPGHTSFSLKITAAGAANEGSKQTVTNLKASTVYRLRARVKCTAGDTARIVTTGAAVDADEELVDDAWADVLTTFTTDSTPSDVVVKILAKNDTDVVWFDDVQVTESSSELGFLRYQSEHDIGVSGDWYVGGITYVDEINEYTTDAGVTIELVQFENGNITMPEDTWIGIGASSERIVFDGTGGLLAFTDTNVSMDGILTVDTINEYTTDAGVIIENTRHENRCISAGRVGDNVPDASGNTAIYALWQGSNDSDPGGKIAVHGRLSAQLIGQDPGSQLTAGQFESAASSSSLGTVGEQKAIYGLASLGGHCANNSNLRAGHLKVQLGSGVSGPVSGDVSALYLETQLTSINNKVLGDVYGIDLRMDIDSDGNISGTTYGVRVQGSVGNYDVDYGIHVADATDNYLNTLSLGALSIVDTGGDHYLSIVCNEDMSADRILNLVPGDAARSLTFEGDAIVSQDYSTDGIVQFGTVQSGGFIKTGWPATPGVTLSFDNGNKRLTVTDGGSAAYYINGTKYTLGGNKTVDITDTEGPWFFYFSGSTLTASQTPWVITDDDKALVAYGYWDQANSENIILGYELHNYIMDSSTHNRMHDGGGCAWDTGLAVTDTGSDTLNVSAGDIWDEDIQVTITDSGGGGLWQQELTPAQIPIYYRDGASNWRSATTAEKVNTTDVGYVVGTDLQYNKLNGTWALANVSSAKHIAMFIIATNNYNEPVVAVMGQREDNTLAVAKANNTWGGLVVAGMPYQEVALLARVILKETGSGLYYTIEDITDLRSTNAEGNVTSPLTTQHDGLGNINWANSGHYMDTALDMLTNNITNAGTIGCGEITVADGSGINLQEDISFTGATTENILAFPDNLAVALNIKGATTSHIIHDTTTNAEQIEYFGGQYVMTKAGTSGALNAVIDSGALNILATAGGTVAAEITFDNSYTTLIGGQGGLLDASGGQAFHIFNIDTKVNCSVRDLRILGNTGEAGANYGFRLDDADYHNIKDVYIEDSDDDCFWVNSCVNGMVSGCWIINPGNRGYISGSGSANRFINNFISGGTKQGWYGTDTFGQCNNNVFWLGHDGVYHAGQYNVIQGNTFADNGGVSITSTSNFSVLQANLIFSPGEYGVNVTAGVGKIIASNFVYGSTWDGMRISTCDTSCISLNNFYLVNNARKDMTVGASDYNSFVGNVGFSQAAKSEKFMEISNSDYNIVIGGVSKAHDTASITLDGTCNHNIVAWNRLESKPTWVAGTNNIILYSDTANMVNEGNYAQAWSAADGARPNTWVLNVENLESTAGESYGILVKAGSTIADYCQQWTDYAGNLLMELDGAGNLGVGVSPTEGWRVHFQDLTIDTTISYKGLINYHIKTLGATDGSDELTGTHNVMELDQVGGTVGIIYGMRDVGTLRNGTTGTLFGNLTQGTIKAGTAGIITGFRADANLDGGTVTGDVFGGSSRVDIEAAMTSVGGNVYGHHIWVDDDKGAAGSVCMLYLDELTGVDYGIYQNGTAPWKVGGDVVIDAGKAFDAYTNAGYMKPRRVSQAAQPTPATGELLIHYDTDDAKTYLVYEDPVGGTRQVEMT